MATYVNNLRLKEITTGDESGTWGTSTNTNLELIGEGLGFATINLGSDADATETVADGSSDGARALYIKVTSTTLTATRTLTIAPNTMKRVHIIENATTGSQDINISQGSGANVTIPNGKTKVVYLDGAGSGAAVVDAYAHLSVIDLTVDDDLSLTSDSSVINMGADNDVTLTHDGTTGVTLAANPITIDSAGDITIDADGGDVLFKDGGTSIIHLGMGDSNAIFNTQVQDKDFIIKGNDGGATITALTIDMSAAGAATFNDDVTAFSDKRLKTDISNISNGLDKVMRMQGVYYRRSDQEDAKLKIGVLAQDMEGIVPEVVLTANDEMQTKSVDYAKLTAVLIEAIKELKQEINELKGS